jgi:hypothetical protein
LYAWWHFYELNSHVLCEYLRVRNGNECDEDVSAVGEREKEEK